MHAPKLGRARERTGERETERVRERQRERQRETERDRETEKQRVVCMWETLSQDTEFVHTNLGMWASLLGVFAAHMHCSRSPLETW